MPKTLHAAVASAYPRIIGWFTVPNADNLVPTDLMLATGPNHNTWACYATIGSVNPDNFELRNTQTLRCLSCLEWLRNTREGIRA